MKNLKTISALVLLTVITLVTSCTSSTEERELKAYVSSYLKDNNEAVAFGSSTLKGILNKTNFRSNEMLDAIVGTQLDMVDAVINLDQPVYFVAEGPLDKDGKPTTLNLFFDIHNADSLSMALEGQSYVLDSVDDIRFVDDGSFILAYDNNIAIACVSWEENDIKSDQLVKKTFERASKELSGGEIDAILGKEGDIVMGVNVENLYATSDTDLNKLDQATQDELKELVKGAYVETVARFENGAAVVETKNTFNDKLKNELFFKKGAPKGYINKLNKGDGQMLAGISINLDVDKMEAFYAKYSPETLEELTSLLGGATKLFSMFSGGKILSQFVDGSMGMVLIGNPEKETYSMNMYAGTTKKGADLFSGFSSYMPAEMQIEKENDGIYGTYSNAKSSNTVSVPKGCENFGTKAITGFVNFEGQSSQEFTVKVLANEEYEGTYKLMEIVQYATFEYDENGGRLYIKAKKGQENVLEQLFNQAMAEYADNVALMGM